MILIKKIKRKFFTKKSDACDLQKINVVISQLSHDLKNNLVTIRANAKNIKHYINSTDSEANLSRINTVVSNIDIKINHSMTILNMVHLFIGGQSDWHDDISHFSINDCIHQSIQNYPFSSSKYSSLVQMLNSHMDFLVKGNKTLLNGIFYCLIKNAVTAMYSLGEGMMAAVILEPDNKENKVHFKISEVKRSDMSSEYDLFSLGTPNNPGNGLNFIQNVVKGMNGRVEFRRESNDMLKLSLIFQ